MKKKSALLCIFSVLMCAVTALVVSACDILNFEWGTTEEHVHNLVRHEAAEPTCTEPGHITYWRCEGEDGCGSVYTDLSALDPVPFESVITEPAAGHKPSDVGAEEATCIHPGHAEGKVCSVCGTVLEGMEEIPAKGHSYEATWTRENAHSAALTLTCPNCTDEEEGHEVVLTAETEPAVTITSEQTKEPSCTEEGELTCTAAVTYNGEDYEDVHEEAVEQLDHKPAAEWTSDETHHWHACEYGCGEELDKEPHAFGDPAWVWAEDHTSATATFTCACGKTHTETATGEMIKTQEEEIAPTEDQCPERPGAKTTYTATVTFGEETYASEPEIVTVPAGEHEWVLDENGVPPTCTQPGHATKKTCSYCQKVVEGAEEIPATGHKYEAKWTWSGTDSAILTLTCPNCTDEEEGHEVVLTADTNPAVKIASEQTKAPSCTEEGELTYTATVTYNEKDYTSVCETKGIVDKLDHTFTGDPAWQWNGIESATATFTCTTCKEETHLENATISSAQTKDPTCTVAGETTYTATVHYNNKDYTDKATEAISPTGHEYEAKWTWTEDFTATLTLTCSKCTNEEGHEVVLTAETEPAVKIESETTAPTCTVAGKTTYTATVTYNEKVYTDETTEAISPTGHEYEAKWTWTEDFTATLTLTCPNCTDEEDGHKVTLTADTDPAVEIKSEQTQKPSCTEDGENTYTATVTYNGKAYTDVQKETVDKLNHKPTAEWTSDETHHWHVCENGCGEELEKAPHAFTEGPVWQWEGTESATATFTCACGKTHTENGDITEQKTDSTCTKEGEITYTATVNYNNTDYTNECETKGVVGKKPHDFEGSEKYGFDDTHHWKICQNCDTPSDEKEAHRGGVEEAGKRKTCEVCGHEYGEEVATPTVTKIEIAEDSNQPKTFTSGDEFSYAGLKLTVSYSNSTTQTIEVGEEPIEGLEVVVDYLYEGKIVLLGSTQKVTVRYGDEQTEYDLEVSEGAWDYTGGEKPFAADLATREGGCNLQGQGDGTFIGSLVSGASFTFTVNVTTEGTFYPILSAAGICNGDALSLSVDSGEEVGIGVNTGNWNNYAEIFIKSAVLTKGVHTFKFSTVNANNNVNVHYFSIAAWNYAGSEQQYGVSDAAVQNAKIEQNAAGFDGYIVGDIQANSSTITFTVKAKEACSAALYIGAAWANLQTEAFEVLVNGVSVGKCDVGTGNWTNFADIFAGNIQLNEGANTIVVKAVNGNFNLGYIKLAPPKEYPKYDGTKNLNLTADQAELAGGCQLDGSNFIKEIKNGTSFTFTVDVTVEDTVTLTLFAAGICDGTALNLTVDAQEPIGISVNTGDWTNFTAIFLGEVTLTRGIHTFMFSADQANGNVNVQSFTIAQKKIFNGKSLTYGASEAELAGGCNIQSNSNAVDGTFIGNLNANCTITFRIMANSDAAVALSLLVDGDSNQEVTYEIYVNDQKVDGQLKTNTTGWGTYHETNTLEATLKAGQENVIVIKWISSTSNLSGLKIAPVEA